MSSRLATFRHDLATWVGQWGYAANRENVPAGHRKPIPFDHMLFSTLDTKISFEEQASRPRSSTVVSSETDAELHHEPDQAIHHDMATRLVVPHHPLRPWEDIPPYQRMRGYNDQPAYTDDYDDFMWLPRDPLSTLDLDDTVEMRLSLTTSAGGSGRIGDWPPLPELEHDETTIDETWQEVYTKGLDRVISPDARSDQPLIDLPLSPHIGSEVEETFGSAGLVRRGTRKVGQGLSTVFKRPRSDTGVTSRSDGISMRTLSISSSPVTVTAGSGPLTAGESSSVDSRPSIMLVPTQPPRERAVTPVLPPIRKMSSASRSAQSQADSLLLSPTRTSTPRQLAEDPEAGEVEELDIASPPRPSHLTFLGRSPSGRRPNRARADSKSSDLRSPTRASSIMGPARSRSIKLGRDRSASIWSNQQAQQRWLQEVMEEEKIASKDSRREELEEEAKDREELEKEEKRRRGSSSEYDLNRSGSIMSGVETSGTRPKVARSASKRSADTEGRPGVERGYSGGSGRSGSILRQGYPPKTAPL